MIPVIITLEWIEVVGPGAVMTNTMTSITAKLYPPSKILIE
jgi:hypothetical protein